MLRLAFMFSAIRAAAPRSGTNVSPTTGWCSGTGIVSASAACEATEATCPPLLIGVLPLDSKTFFQLSSTARRSFKYCWYSSSSSQLLIPNSGGRDSDMEDNKWVLLYDSVAPARKHVRAMLLIWRLLASAGYKTAIGPSGCKL